MRNVNKAIDDKLRPRKYHEIRINGLKFVDWYGRLVGEMYRPNLLFLCRYLVERFLDFDLANNVHRAVDKGLRDENYIRTNRK